MGDGNGDGPYPIMAMNAWCSSEQISNELLITVATTMTNSSTTTITSGIEQKANTKNKNKPAITPNQQHVSTTTDTCKQHTHT